ncbi:MAG: hypothetical protein M1821_004599 [Bathelium mastoideum]|nr:MAG: hypothetical protein M1821_004599 [Bathelium mastoideum]
MDLEHRPQGLSAIHQYLKNVRATQDERMDIEDSSSSALEARLDQTVKDLQDKVVEQRRALEQVQAPRIPSANPLERLQQLRAIKASYDFLTNSKPSLPSVESPLPAVLATQVAQRKIVSTKEAISELQSRLTHARRRLEEEERNLKDNELIAAKLHERIARVRQVRDEQLHKSSADIVNEQVHAKQAQKEQYEQEIKSQHQALENFVDNLLAPLVAAEELGGPTVGDLIDVSVEMLENGFSAQGKPKSASRSSSATKKGQMRLDKHGNLVRDVVEEPSSQKAAVVGLKELLNELLDASFGSSTSGRYITLQRDSAAVRFLVRTKIAQFHPKDARRLRLIDDGRALDD